jgi:hypothetical protein
VRIAADSLRPLLVPPKRNPNNLIRLLWDWWEAWVFAIICILGFAVSRALAERRNPGLLAERARFMQHEDAKP